METYYERSLRSKYRSQGVQTSFCESTPSPTNSLGDKISTGSKRNFGHAGTDHPYAPKERDNGSASGLTRVLLERIPGKKGFSLKVLNYSQVSSETSSTSFSFVRSDKPVYATAQIRPCGPCQPTTAMAGPTFSYLRNPDPPLSGGLHYLHGRLQSGLGRSHGGFQDFGYLDPYRPQAPHQLSGAQGGYLRPTALGSSASGPPGHDRHGQFDSGFIYQQAGRDSLHFPATLDCRPFPLVRVSRHSSPGETHSRLPERDSRPPISSESANTDRVVPAPRDRESNLQGLGTPEVDMFATLSNSHLPRFMSPVPEPRALAVDALSQDWQGRSMYMFPPFPLLSKVVQKLRSTQVAEVILVAPWWPSQPWFPHLLRLCVEHPLIKISHCINHSCTKMLLISDGKECRQK